MCYVTRCADHCGWLSYAAKAAATNINAATLLLRILYLIAHSKLQLYACSKCVYSCC